MLLEPSQLTYTTIILLELGRLMHLKMKLLVTVLLALFVIILLKLHLPLPLTIKLLQARLLAPAIIMPLQP